MFKLIIPHTIRRWNMTAKRKRRAKAVIKASIAYKRAGDIFEAGTLEQKVQLLVDLTGYPKAECLAMLDKKSS